MVSTETLVIQETTGVVECISIHKLEGGLCRDNVCAVYETSRIWCLP